MSNLRTLVILLTCAAFSLGGGDTPERPAAASKPAADQQISVTLTGHAPTAELHLGYPRHVAAVVETTVPRFVFEVPEFQDKKPLFFRLALGEARGDPFYAALDRSPETGFHDRLYIDLDRDLDLTNDGPPQKAVVRDHWETGRKVVEFLGVTLPVPYKVDGKEVRESYPCVFYYLMKGKVLPKSVQMERAGWRQGEFTFGGEDYTVTVVDDDCDGLFATSDSWSVLPRKTAARQRLHPDVFRSMLYPAWSTDRKSFHYRVVELDMAGRNLKLKAGPALKTEREFFVQIYTDRQTPEERMLKLDPLRPKAADDEKVDWLVNKKGVAYALEIAAGPNVDKPVLVDFTAQNCVWCARMNKYTFRDREVAQLCKKFVCAKVMHPSADSGKYDVEGTPTYVIFSKDGTEIARQQGFSRPRDFAAWLKSALR